MDLTTQTPEQIDTQLAEVYGRWYKTMDVVGTVEGYIKKHHEGAAKFAQGMRVYRSCTPERLAELEAKLEAARAAADVVLAEAEPFEAEFTRRGGWSRFYQVQDGHIHSSRHCHSCRPTTRYGWHPEWSGRTEEEALAALIEESRKTILCTFCYPSAPVAWTKPREEEGLCQGGGTWDYDRNVGARLGYMSGNYAVCGHCHTRQTVLRGGKLRKHKLEAAA